ncbi:iron-sulfur cluster carrier protein ApbC [Arenicella xantha]|uniref:Iron-sulfur cluster carrier protein n=1 Tax=Arenicella xantha TaxID=644221 RepID=A0A395JFA2_9GAMM|nr:iron-sulfur cluster carrier protein ApbC [Arenicella xantha]RBP48462.1 ATP-binding protein involved in chromosome partitioning [Arenicella xantha]
MSDQIITAVTNQLHSVTDPYTNAKLTAGRSLKSVKVNEAEVVISLSRGYPVAAVIDELASLVRDSLRDVPLGERALEVVIEQEIISHSAQTGVPAVAGIKNIIAVASGKGGVGKSTVSANLALALSASGARVAILDADIYGPSQPRMLGIKGKPEALDNKMLLPMQNHGIKVMSIGFLIEDDTPMIWRGPMVTQALEQMLRGTDWANDGNEIDYLVIDLPPGTGDIQLTLSQKVPVSGAVIVTTPQDMALLDARKAYKMFEKVDVPVFGVIENMSTHICTQCGHEEAIFGSLGAQKMADEYKLDVLGNIPLEMAIRELADSGTPTVVAQPESATAKRYLSIALKVAGKLSAKKKDFSASFPKIVVENS